MDVYNLSIKWLSWEKLPKIPGWQIDKLVHTLMYGILSFCSCLPFFKQFSVKQNHFNIGVKIVLFGIFYGGFMEILQTNIFINRSGNIYDFIANTAGSIIGVFIQPYVMKLLPLNKWLN